MKAIKATYCNGQVTLAEPPPQADGDAVEILVIFPNADPWQHILDDTRARPALEQMLHEVEKEIAEGNTNQMPKGKLP